MSEQDQGPKPESSLDRPITRRDFLKLLGLGGAAYVGIRVAPYVEPKLKQGLAELDAKLSENNDTLYFRLTRGEYAVRMETVDSESANKIWNDVLTRKEYEGDVTTTESRVDDNGELWFYLKNTGRKYIYSGQEAELSYIPPKGSRVEMVKMQINGNEIYIAPYTTEFQEGTPNGKTETRRETIYTFVDREGNSITNQPGTEWASKGRASILFAATKAISPSGETVRAVVDTRVFRDNGKIFDIEIPDETAIRIQIGENSYERTKSGLFKNGDGQFFRAAYTRTGLNYLQENWGHPVAAYPPSSTETVVK